MSILGSNWKAKYEEEVRLGIQAEGDWGDAVMSLRAEVHRVTELARVPWASDDARDRAFAEGIWAARLGEASGARGRFTVQDVLDAVTPTEEVS